PALADLFHDPLPADAEAGAEILARGVLVGRPRGGGARTKPERHAPAHLRLAGILLHAVDDDLAEPAAPVLAVEHVLRPAPAQLEERLGDAHAVLHQAALALQEDLDLPFRVGGERRA